MAIKMRTDPRLYPTSILPLQRGGMCRDFISEAHGRQQYPMGLPTQNPEKLKKEGKGDFLVPFFF
jgi:hypothetical protein